MARQTINNGSVSNDGTGDSLRQTAQKVNENFVEVYDLLGGDSGSGAVRFSGFRIAFDGTDANDIETFLGVVNPTANRTVTIPDDTGILLLDSASQVMSNKTIESSSLTSPSINDQSADHSYNITPAELAGDVILRMPVATDSDTIVFNRAAAVLTNKTINNAVMSFPSIVDAIEDANGANVIAITSTASAVNEITVANAAAAGSPTISSTGASTNVDLRLESKGSGAINFRTKVAYLNETRTANGAINLSRPLTLFNSAGALAMTMANGTVNGESKKFININTGDATVTPASFAQGTSFTVHPDGGCEAVWTGSNWHLMCDSNQYLTIN